METHTQESKEPPRFAVLAADTALFTMRENKLFVRLIPLHRPPAFENRRGLPGGLLLPHETAEEASLRILESKTGIAKDKIFIEQLYTFSRINRDPRGRVVAVTYIAFVPWEKLSDKERGVHEGSEWCHVAEASLLAYDHDEVLALALTRLRSRVVYTTLIQKILSHEFTLTELEEAYEAVLGKSIDKRNFRKKILKLDILKELPHKREGGRHRPAKLYQFKHSTVEEIEVI